MQPTQITSASILVYNKIIQLLITKATVLTFTVLTVPASDDNPAVSYVTTDYLHNSIGSNNSYPS